MAIQSINVSQLKCACLDPQWRKKWLNGENPSTFSFAPSGTAPVYGTLFHKFAENYVGWLTSPKHRKITAKLADEHAHWHEMYERFAEKKLTELLESQKIDSAFHLAEALKAFCRRVSELRSRIPNFRSWEDVYLTKEFPIQDVRFAVGKSNIFISGQLDAVRIHPDHGVEVVDYKLSHGGNMKHDLLQLAVYAKLLSIKKPGIQIHGLLEYYEPALHETPVSGEELESIFQEIVEPVLYELAGEKNPSKQSITPASESRINTDDLDDKIQNCYAAFKLSVEIIGKHEAPQLIRYRLKPAAGVKVVSLANRAEDLQVALSLKKPPLIAPAQGCVTIDIPKEQPDTVLWRDVWENPVYAGHESFVSFPVGIGVDNQVLIADFADPNMCHGLVAGVSGSGKSEFLKSLTASLIAKNSPGTLKLSIIDPKILTFGSLSECPYLTEPVITDVSAAISCLEAAVEEMDERYRHLGKEGVEDLSTRFRDGKRDIPFYVIVFDEFADLILAGKEEKKAFENLVARLAAKGRAAGIHLILTTQRPDRNIVTGLIKSNLPLKICLRVTNSTNSQIILDQTGGESLLGRGDLLCDRGKDIERAQSPYIPQDELMQIAGGLKKGKRIF
jgi:S-DNA-T family DNA segregation ATPase FtsK/SpoIIIE